MNDQHPAHALQQPSAFDDPSPLRPEFSRAADGKANVSTGLLGDGPVNALISALREADAESDSRSAAIISLVGVVEFLRNIPEIEQYDLHSTIWKLAVALKDIDRGVISPIFADPYAGISNRREQGSDIRIIKAYSSYCVELLMHVGIGLDVACRHVADGLSKADFKIRGKVNTPPWRTVRGWREGLSKLSSDNNPERSTVDGLRANDPVTDGMTHAQAVQHVAALLKLLVRKTVT